MKARQRVAAWLVALGGLGVLVWLASSTVSRLPAASDGDLRRDAGPPNGEPRLRGQVQGRPEPATTESQGAAPEAVETAWRLEVRAFDGDGRLLRGLPAEGGGTNFACTVRFHGEGGETVVGHPDEEGITRLSVRGAGRVSVRPASPWRPFLSDLVAREPSGARRIDVQLEKGLEITGTLLDHRGDPLERPVVRARPVSPMPWGLDASRWTWRDATKADGSFRIQGLLPGTYRLEVRLWPRDIGGEASADPGRPPAPPLVEAGTDGVIIQLLPPTAYTLHFVDAETGEPVRVNVNVYTRVGDYESWQTATWGGTECEVDAPASLEGVVHLEAEGYRPHDLTHDVFVDHAHDRRIEVPLRADPGSMVSLRLRLRDDAGRAVEEITLSRRMTMGRDRGAGSWTGQTLEVPGGSLDLRYGAGPVDLMLDPADAGWQRFLLPVTLGLYLERGSPLEQDVVFETGGAVLVRDPTGANVGFFVRGPDGASVPTRASWRACDDGSRELAPIPPGDWQLVFVIDGQHVPVDTHVVRGAVSEVVYDPASLDR